MLNSHILRFTLVTLALAILLLAGCRGTSEKSRFYKLSAILSADEATKPAGKGVVIGIGPIKFPDHLDRPEVVTRTSRNALEIGEFDRWAGSLREDFSRVLTENLSILLSTDYVFVFPWGKTIPIDYQVKVEVSRFDGELGKSATLIARWSILQSGEEKALKSVRRSSISKPAEDKSYEAMVAALSRTVEQLSQEIAETIQTLSQKGM
jgi:uncharacterized lipoprotein YmbA